MQRAVLEAPRRFTVVEGPVPTPGPDQLLLRIHGCGVCGSNVPPWLGTSGVEYPMPPGAPGHEVFGEVVTSGAANGAAAVPSPGQRVVALTERSFAEYELVDRRQVVPLPETLADQPLLGEPLACAVNVVERAGVQPGDAVVVIGVGFLGALVLQLLRCRQPSLVVAVSRRPVSREVAERYGVAEALAYDGGVEARVSELTDGRLADVVIEATGLAAPLDLAGRLTRVRGRLVIAGYHQEGRREVDLQLWNWRGLDVINAHERAPERYLEGLRQGIALAADGEVEMASLITHTFPLTEINRAFATAAKRPEGFVKAVILP